MFVSAEISDIVRKSAIDAGFELAGIAPITDPKELEYFPRWIAEGRAGEMKYLEARDDHGRLKRASLAHAAPWARSIVVCAINYNTSQPYSTHVSDRSRGWISRYAWSREDYHESVMRRLRQVETALWNAYAAHATTNATLAQARASADFASNPFSSNPKRSGFHNEDQLITRCYVDTGPIVERVVAKYAGIGWIGKNTCLINQKLGSWLFLGVILTSLDLVRNAASLPAPDRCGSCTRCIEACPTNALIAPYQLDSNKCISYLTIEKRGTIGDDSLRSGMGSQVFGCDICQDVCPWNRKAPATKAAGFQPRPELVNPELEWLAKITDEEYRVTFRGSPVRRAKRAGLRRNAVIAMGNSGDKKFLPSLEKLAQDEDEAVRESAAWAVRQISKAK
jgi:epoxyqueuosine reductase